MSEFFHAVARYEFMQMALITGILASIACGVVGTYVVVRRITYIAGAIAHCVLGGMGIARYLQAVYGLDAFHPIYGALASALVAAVIIGLVNLHAKEREDTAIGALWAIGMAVGILFISKTPGYGEDLMGYLFGNILMVSSHDLWMIGALDIVVVAVGLIFFRQLQAVCFDQEFARLRGLNVEFYYLMLLCLTALTVVLLITVVGIIMVIALLTLPVAIAGHLSKRLRQMMMLSIIFCAILTSGGLAISYSPDLPAGATIVILAGAAYLITLIAFQLRKFG
ncbi:MAG: metal ABC transporter permease [Pseudomonadota bacterium]